VNHYLCILGPPEEAQALLEQGVVAFERLCRRKEVRRSTTGAIALAVLPTPTHQLSTLEAATAAPIVGASSATLFYERKSGARALVGLLDDLGRAWDVPARMTETLDGFFSVVAVHRDRQEVVILTDRIGAAHVFQTRVGSCTVLGTSSLVLAALSRAEIDPHGARQLVATGTLFETPRTLFVGVEKLAPASVFRFTAGGRSSTSVYWDPKAVLDDSRSPRRPAMESVQRLGDALVETVRTIRENFARPLFDLSGGLDTRSILGAALRGGSKPTLIVNGPDNDRDVIAAKRIATRFGLHINHRFDRLGDPESRWRQVHTAMTLCDGEVDALSYSFIGAVHEPMSHEYDISVNGCGGEFCKGYYWELLLPFLGRHAPLDAYRIASRRFVFTDDYPKLLAVPFDQTLAEHMTGVVRRAIEGMERHRNTAQLDLVYMRLRVQRFYGRIASSTSQIWPIASPYCFRGPIEACITTPPWQRRAEKMSRRLNEYLNPELANMPLERGHPAVPLRLTNLHRFYPLARENARAVTRRVLRNVGIKVKEEVWLPFSGDTKRSQLMELDEVASMLDPARMTTAHLYDGAVLRDLVGRWPQDDSLDPRMARILTLELAGRAAAECARALPRLAVHT
jgi:hypothetical protein